MNRDDIRKLIGGYATGTLTDQEQKLLFDAALDDQDLFDELAREQELKELLEAPGVRARLAAAVAPAEPMGSRWLWAGGSAFAAAALMLVVVIMRTPEPVQIAAVTPPAVQDRAEDPAQQRVQERVPEARQRAEPAPAPATPPRQSEPQPLADKTSNEPEARKAEAPPPPPSPARQTVTVTAESAPVLASQATGQGAAAAKELDAVRSDSASKDRATANKEAGAVAGFVSRPAPASAPPPPAPAAQRVALPAVAFRYDLTSGVLQLTPGADGQLSITFRGSNQPAQSRSATAGALIAIPIPPDATSVVLGFSRVAGGITGAPVRVQKAGAVEFPANSLDRVLVEIPAQ